MSLYLGETHCYGTLMNTFIRQKTDREVKLQSKRLKKDSIWKINRYIVTELLI